MRLIDASELVPDCSWDTFEDGYTAVSVAQLQWAPTVDAVEVIRCADCKYQTTREDSRGTHYKYCKLIDEFAFDEHFCGWAERKDGAENATD